ncbi:hypothetical protein PGQ11_009465 [Apiospora arundinis]|uniref:Ankyrin repeat protein n=1 Tax=Apiospora arundinis TaxID=335852 RepID=A0ABR2II12_9PEZI
MWPRHSRTKKNHWMITGFYTDLKPPTALRAAVSAGHGDVVRLLLRPEHRLQPLASRGTPDEGPPLYERENPGSWLIRHLISLGAQTTEDKYRNGKEKGKRFIRDVHVTQRTWEWISKF